MSNNSTSDPRIWRQSEQVMNDELYKIYQLTRHIADVPKEASEKPHAEVSGTLWYDSRKNELNAYDKLSEQWKTIFSQKFQIVDEITSDEPPADPVKGELWLYNGVLCYWNGTTWKPVKALQQDASQFDFSLFENFLLMHPLQAVSIKRTLGDDTATGLQDVESLIYVVPRDCSDMMSNRYRMDSSVADLSLMNTLPLDVFYADYSNVVTMDRAFKGCSILRKDKLPAEMESLSKKCQSFNSIFEGCLGLKNTVTLYIGAVGYHEENGKQYPNIVDAIKGCDNILDLNLVASSDETKEYFENGTNNFADKSLLALIGASEGVSVHVFDKDGKLLYQEGENTSAHLLKEKYQKAEDKKGTSPKAVSNSVRQFVIPNTDYDRIFFDDKLDTAFTKINGICAQYPEEYIDSKVPAAIHVNPLKLSNIKKRLFKIDRITPLIGVGITDTEFYGYRTGDARGHLLVPEITQDDGGYIPMKDSIYLSKEQSQTYDYVLAVTYTFGWMKSTGSMKHVNWKRKASTFYIPSFTSPLSTFVDGFEISDTDTSEDTMSNTITIKDMGDEERDVQALHSVKREAGFIRQIDLKGWALIETVQEFCEPLIFVNGEAMNSSIKDVIMKDREGNVIDRSIPPENRHICHFEVKNGLENMTWTVIELQDYAKNGKVINGNNFHNDYNMLDSQGLVPPADASNKVLIHYESSDITPSSAVLFVDGLCISRQDMIIDEPNKTITVDGLKPGQDYILLKDKYHFFSDSTTMQPAIEVSAMTDSLVYLNGYLLLDHRQLLASASSQAEHNSNQVLLQYTRSYSTDGTFEDIISSANIQRDGKWEPLPDSDLKNIMTFADSYENAVRSVKYNKFPINGKPYTLNKEKDDIEIYAYSCANDYSNVITITNIPAQLPVVDGKKNKQYVINQQDFNIGAFMYPSSSLEVYVNGVRQYGNGDKFDKDYFEDTKSEAEKLDEAPEISPNGRHFSESEIAKEMASERLFLKDSSSNMIPVKRDSKGQPIPLTTVFKDGDGNVTTPIPFMVTNGTKTEEYWGRRLNRKEILAIMSKWSKYSDITEASKSQINDAYTLKIDSGDTIVHFKEPVTGYFTYVVKPPEKGQNSIGTSYYLDYNNAVPGTTNIYRIDESGSMYPGRVVVYVNGIRQPADSYVLLDNRTIMFLSQDTALLGNSKNFRLETREADDGSKITERVEYMHKDGITSRLVHKNSDQILIEVLNDYGWNESHFTLKQTKDNFKIVLDDYEVSNSMLNSSDEIKIYIDGLFIGLRNNEGYRRVVNLDHPVLEIINPGVIDRLRTDPMYNYLISTPGAMLAYKNTHGGKEYLPAAKDIILEWR